MVARKEPNRTWLGEVIWFCMWAVIVGFGAWLFGKPPNLIPLVAFLGGLGGLAALNLLR
jgi:hypothetical protein